MTTNDSINIQEVVARFKNSAEVLEELRSRLQSLTKTDELHAASLASAQNASQALQEISEYMRDATNTLREAITTADTALGTATRFMEATDLSEVGRQLEAVATKQDLLRADLLAPINELAEQVTFQLVVTRRDLDAARAELESARAERDELDAEVVRINAELETLRSTINAVPDRVRAKHGL